MDWVYCFFASFFTCFFSSELGGVSNTPLMWPGGVGVSLFSACWSSRSLACLGDSNPIFVSGSVYFLLFSFIVISPSTFTTVFFSLVLA